MILGLYLPLKCFNKLEVQENLYKQRINGIVSREGEKNSKN